MTFARIYIVRHGETQENKAGVIQGQLDTRLNDTGKQQAELVARVLENVRFDFAYTSDLSRAVETAETILVYHPGVQLVKAVELREKFMGVLEGLTFAERAQLPSASYAESIEPSKAFVGRMTNWWKRHIDEHIGALPSRSTPYNILVVSHGGTIGTLVQDLIGSGKVKRGEGVMTWKLLNTSITIIDFSEEREAVLIKYGDISHLLGKQVVQNNADVKE